jgi:hypothetical protein
MKLIKEDDKLFHFKGKDGEFKIVKKGLSKPAMDKIQKLKEEQGLCAGGKVQKFVHGGDVEAQFDAPVQVPEDDEINPGQSVIPDRAIASEPQDNNFEAGSWLPTTATPAQAQAAYGAPALPAKQPLMEIDPVTGQIKNPDPAAAAQATGQAPQVADQAQAAQAAPGAPPKAPSDPNDLQGLVNQQAGLLKTQGKQTQDQMSKAADLQEQFLTHQQEFNDESLANHQRIQQQNEELFNAVRDGKVDPHQYVSNMSIGSKIGTALSIALSGMGAGANGTNLAMSVLQKKIDQDIESQKQNLNNKSNLLTQNLHREGNMYAAEAATRAQMLSMFSGQAQAMAMRSGSQMAMTNANLLANQTRMAAEPAIMAQNRYQMGMKIAANPNATPQEKIQFNPITSPEQKNKAMEELGNVESNKRLAQQAIDLQQKGSGEDTLFNRAIHGGSAPASKDMFSNIIAESLKNKGIRASPEMVDKIADSYWPGPGEGETKTRAKLQGLPQFFAPPATPNLDLHGVKISKLPILGAK